MKPIVIFGAGGFAREVAMLLRDVNDAHATWDILGYLDDDAAAHGTVADDLPVLGGRDWLAARNRDVHVVLAIGGPVWKLRISQAIRPLVASFPTLIHPTALSSRYNRIGEGVVVTAMNVITSQVTLGDFVMLNLACTVGHDAVIGAYTTLSPSCNVSGHVTIGEGCDIGTGTKIVQGVSIGEWTVVGAGAVVARDVPANSTAVGVPAKAIKERPAGWHLADAGA